MNFSTAAAQVAEEGERTAQRVAGIEEVVDDPRLERIRRKLEVAQELDPDSNDTEQSQEAMDGVLEARRLLSEVRRDNLKVMRQLDLDGVKDFFEQVVREFARPSEEKAFDNLVKTAQRSIDRNEKDFEGHLDELRGKIFEILWRQDWFVVEKFKAMTSSPHNFSDLERFKELVAHGLVCMQNDDIDSLRQVVAHLSQIQISAGTETDMLDLANIVRG